MGEVEGGEALVRRQMGILQVTLDAPLITLGKLMLEQGCETMGGRPPLAIRSAKSAHN